MQDIKAERNVGIELLRIIAMGMIVLFHITGYYWKTSEFSSAYVLNEYLRLSLICCVNIFGMISGWVLSRSQIHIAKLLELWFQCLFYSITILICFKVISHQPPKMTDMFYFVPVLSGCWWYITAYFGIILFIPLLNSAFTFLPIKSQIYIGIGFFLLYSIGSCICLRADVFNLRFGYCAFWLLCCYVFGAILRSLSEKYGPIRMRPLLAGMLIIQFFYIIPVLWKLLELPLWKGINAVNGNYISPLAIIQAAFFLLLFAQLKISNNHIKAIVMFLSPLALGVYLIHVHPCLFEVFCKEGGLLGNISIPGYLWETFFVLFLIYFGCSFIDLGRKKLFEIIKIKVLSRKMEDLIVTSLAMPVLIVKNIFIEKQ